MPKQLSDYEAPSNGRPPINSDHVRDFRQAPNAQQMGTFVFPPIEMWLTWQG